MGQPGDISDPKALCARLAAGCYEHQRRRNPSQAGEADSGEGSGQQQSGEEGKRITALQERIGPEFFQPPQLAAKNCKGKQWGSSVIALSKKKSVWLHGA